MRLLDPGATKAKMYRRGGLQLVLWEERADRYLSRSLLISRAAQLE